MLRTWMRSFAAALLLSLLGLGVAGSPAAAADAEADLRTFVEAGFHGSTDEEYRAWAEVLAASTAGPSTPRAAADALAGTVEELRAFVDGGYLVAWHADERLRVARALADATGPSVRNGAQDALDSADPAAWSYFLSTLLPRLQHADDRLMAATMLTGGVNNSGPALDAAAQAALAGTPAELREFLLTGQFVARAIDAQAAAPAAPAAPPAAAPPAAAAQPAQVAAPAARAASSGRVLAATGPAQDLRTAALAAAVVVAGAGLVLLGRRARRD